MHNRVAGRIALGLFHAQTLVLAGLAVHFAPVLLPLALGWGYLVQRALKA